MKSKWILTAALSVMMPLAAQPLGPRMPRPGGGDPARMLQHLGTVLDLTESQKTAATSIFDAAKKQAEPLGTALKTSHDAVEAAVKANKSDVEIDDLTAKQGTMTGQIASIQAKARRSFMALLTTEQREKLDKLHAQMPERRPGGPRQ